MAEKRTDLSLMRSVLTVPVTNPRFIEKAPGTGADVICLDLEDSIAPAEKEGARVLAAKAIEVLSSPLPRSGRGAGGEGLVFVRVNGEHTGLLDGDISAVVRSGLDGIIVSKASSVETIRDVDTLLTRLEAEQGMTVGTVAIAPLIETAPGVMAALDIVRASPRVTAAVFGAEDLATDIGVQRTREGEEIRWARAQVAMACHAVRVTPVDTPDPDYTDEAYLETEMVLGRSLGYRGKLCIHPTQVAMANRIFAPSAEEIEEAREVVALFEREGIAQGRAAIPRNGRMIDTPIYERAKRLLESARSPDQTA
jgi:citrate lyase subunit beta/citryl-CoA lyase